MSSTAVAAPDRPTAQRQRGSAPRWAKLLAVGLGLLGVLMAVATPLLPVRQSTATLTWPQQGVLTGVTAPLVSYAPHRLELMLPCAVATTAPAGNRVLVTTVPPTAPASAELSLLAQTSDGRLNVTLRGQPVLSSPLSSLNSPGCTVRVVATTTSTTTELQGSTRTIPGDLRPQLVGVFSDLQGPAPAGLSVTAEVNDRYSSTPTPLKLAAMLLGAGCVLGSVVALYRLARVDGRRHVRALPARWWVLRRLDGVVVGVLGVWYLIGANTSDDGYLLTMARGRTGQWLHGQLLPLAGCHRGAVRLDLPADQRDEPDQHGEPVDPPAHTHCQHSVLVADQP